MAISALDRRTALILVDLQKGIVAYDTLPPTSGVVAQAARLAEAFRKQGQPVVLVNVTGGAPGRVEQSRSGATPPSDWADLVTELCVQPQDYRVTKKTWGAFTGTDLEQYLKSCGVTQVVLAGISTSIGVESTARAAYELGFNVVLVKDAMTDTNADAHSNSLSRIFPRLGEIGTTADVLALLG